MVVRQRRVRQRRRGVKGQTRAWDLWVKNEMNKMQMSWKHCQQFQKTSRGTNKFDYTISWSARAFSKTHLLQNEIEIKAQKRHSQRYTACRRTLFLLPTRGDESVHIWHGKAVFADCQMEHRLLIATTLRAESLPALLASANVTDNNIK